MLSHTGWRSRPRNGERLPVPPPRQGSPDGSRVRWASLNRDQRSTGAWNARGTRCRRWGHTRGCVVERGPRGVELAWMSSASAVERASRGVELPWNWPAWGTLERGTAVDGPWNCRGTQADARADPALRRGVAWNWRAWGSLERGTTVELPWKSRSVLQNSPARKAMLLTRSFSGEWCGNEGRIYPLFPCAAPCSHPVTSTPQGHRRRRITRGMPQWSEGGQKAAQSRKEGRARALPDRHHSDPPGRSPFSGHGPSTVPGLGAGTSQRAAHAYAPRDTGRGTTLLASAPGDVALGERIPTRSPCAGARRVCAPILHARGGRH